MVALKPNHQLEQAHDLAQEIFVLAECVFRQAGNQGVTGRVVALDQKDGRQVWRFEVVPDSEAARATWGNAPTVPLTGGAFWEPPTVGGGRLRRPAHRSQ